MSVCRGGSQLLPIPGYLWGARVLIQVFYPNTKTVMFFTHFVMVLALSTDPLIQNKYAKLHMDGLR